MSNRQNTETEDATNQSFPMLTRQDAADYLADILPQLAVIATRSGLVELGEMVRSASRLANNAKDIDSD
ncbi:MAG: hypothetical protein JKX99_03095 [Robiginitomaculum sp.]|nr:hypothetical protein [Robiginitomaculum sp.]